jgi:hypothetical protein
LSSGFAEALVRKEVQRLPSWICRQAFDAQQITKKAVSHVQTIKSTSGRAHFIRHYAAPDFAEPHQSDRLKAWLFYRSIHNLCPGSLPGPALVCQPSSKSREPSSAVFDRVSLWGDEFTDDMMAII